jgi:hypothetical protein
VADFNLLPEPYKLATGATLAGIEDVQKLWDAGIRAVIDCRSEFDDGALIASFPGMKYIWLPVDDDGQPKPLEWFAAGYGFARAIWLHEADEIIYAHCAAGVNRGPSMCYFLLRSLYALDPKDAEAAIRQVRPQVGIAYKADADRACTDLFGLL